MYNLAERDIKIEYLCMSLLNRIIIYTMKELIRNRTKDIYPTLIQHFRHLHAHPELSYMEFETSKYIQKQLEKLNIPFETGYGGTGILARIEGRNPSKRIIALRADMDALPIQEEVDLPWKSLNDNVMHACGHDAHMTALLGAATVLKEISNHFEGTILLVFQPGEEKAPGGAKLMLDDGVFDKYKPEFIIGQHISDDYPTGSLAFRGGTVMASADEIYITIRGKGGHAAKPHSINDTVLAASQTIVALQQVKSRLCPPLVPMVLSFGKFIASGATNVIPHKVEIAGTFRTYDEEWRKKAKEHIKRIINETAAAYGCTADIEMPDGYPNLHNDEELTARMEKYAVEYMGEENVHEVDYRLSSEDFAFFSQEFPSCFYRFGSKSEATATSGSGHTSTFRIDEEALIAGAGGMVWLAYKLMTE